MSIASVAEPFQGGDGIGSEGLVVAVREAVLVLAGEGGAVGVDDTEESVGQVYEALGAPVRGRNGAEVSVVRAAQAGLFGHDGVDGGLEAGVEHGEDCQLGRVVELVRRGDGGPGHAASRRSSSRTCSISSRSTVLSFRLAAHLSARVATRSMSRRRPRAASWSMATASDEESSRSAPARLVR